MYGLFVGGQVKRVCDVETGNWSDIDFSECTLPPAQQAFVLLWLTLGTGDRMMVNNRRLQIEQDVYECIRDRNYCTVGIEILVANFLRTLKC